MREKLNVFSRKYALYVFPCYFLFGCKQSHAFYVFTKYWLSLAVDLSTPSAQGVERVLVHAANMLRSKTLRIALDIMTVHAEVQLFSFTIWYALHRFSIRGLNTLDWVCSHMKITRTSPEHTCIVLHWRVDTSQVRFASSFISWVPSGRFCGQNLVHHS